MVFFFSKTNGLTVSLKPTPFSYRLDDDRRREGAGFNQTDGLIDKKKLQRVKQETNGPHRLPKKPVPIAIDELQSSYGQLKK